MKTQFRPNAGVKCLTDKDFPKQAKTQFDPIKTQMPPNSVMPCCRTLRPGAPRTRRLLQPICRQFADSADFGFVASTNNLPIFARKLPILALAELRNPSISHRRVGLIHRSGCQNRSVDSTRKHHHVPLLRWRRGSPNRKVIVNRFSVIVNSAALSPSRIHQSRVPIHQFASESSTSRNQIRNRMVKLAGEYIRKYQQPTRPVSATAEIYHRAGRSPAIRLLESSDNHPTHPANLPIIQRRIPRRQCCKERRIEEAGEP